jgi:hypothetical protein
MTPTREMFPPKTAKMIADPETHRRATIVVTASARSARSLRGEV